MNVVSLKITHTGFPYTVCAPFEFATLWIGYKYTPSKNAKSGYAPSCNMKALHIPLHVCDTNVAKDSTASNMF